MKLRSFILLAALYSDPGSLQLYPGRGCHSPAGICPSHPACQRWCHHPPRPQAWKHGKAIYAEKCAACHGETGLGDGAQGIQLGVTVPAFGLAEIARPATPADWFTTVTRGRMERFMPPFTSLNDEQRWDVVAYAMSLHISRGTGCQGQGNF